MDIEVGCSYYNNSGQKYTIISLGSKNKSGNQKYLIRFELSGYEKEVEKVEIKRGKIKDKFSPSVFGVGILGDLKMVDYKREYSVWRGMLERCYDPKCQAYSGYGGRGVKVCERWLTFKNFLEDIEKIEGFNRDLFNKGEIFLDKDIKQQNKNPCDKIYSLETCKFVSFEENNAVRNNEHRKISFIAISPEGNIFEVQGLKEFCRNNNLTRTAVAQCLQGKAKTHKGWKFKKI
jgi:hypothetical protein